MPPRRRPRFMLSPGCCIVLIVAAGSAGCATQGLERSRRHYRAERLADAEAALSEVDFSGRDALLLHLERATIRQALGLYDSSAEDFLAADAYREQQETYSLSRGAASLIISDQVQTFRGLPYEWALLHAFAAKNYLARGLWDSAAVEARRILIVSDENRRGGYPDNAYSRYLAGVCLEAIADYSNAALQYRLASALLENSGLSVDERSGRLVPERPPPDDPLPAEEGEQEADDRGDSAATGENNEIPAFPVAALPRQDVEPWPVENTTCELVCFVLLGQLPRNHPARDTSWRRDPPLYAELYHDGVRLGRSYPLVDVAELALASEQRRAFARAAKTATRLVLKESVAGAVSNNNELLGGLLRLFFYAFEEPDFRYWSTLPRWLHVARVPCPEDMQSFEARIMTTQGRLVRTVQVEESMQRRGALRVAFFRDLPIPLRGKAEDRDAPHEDGMAAGRENKSNPGE